MPDLPISGLPNAAALAGTEPVPIVQGGVTVKTTAAAIAALATGGVTDGDKGDITVSSSGTVWTVDPSVISNSKLANVATATFKGRTTAGTGAPEDLTVAQAKTLLNLSGTNTGDQTITLTGDVTGSGTGSFAATIANDTVTNAKAANMATATIKGRTTAGTGDPEDLTATQVKALLAIAAGDVSGLAAIATSGNASDLAGTKPSTFITDFTEAAQDSVGVMVNSTLVYNDATPSLGRAAITGDVTISAGSNAATIPAGTVTLAQQANLAANSIVGNNTGSAATPIALTGSEVTAMLDLYSDTNDGIVPAFSGVSGQETLYFLNGQDWGTVRGVYDYVSLTNSFSAGDIVKRSGVNYALSDAASSSDGLAHGIVYEASGLHYVVQTSGLVASSLISAGVEGGGGFVNNTQYYLSPTTPGKMTATKPTSVGDYVTPILFNGIGKCNILIETPQVIVAPSGGVPDGDKGDITVSSSGIVWTIDNDAVTYGKIQNVTGNSFLGRAASGSGDVGEVAVGASELVGRGSTGNITAITLGTNLSMSGTTLNATGGGGVSDGDKGDITVSSGGTVWTIDPSVVSNSKLADVATATFKGRTTAGTGSPEDLTVAQAKTLLNLAGTNTGDQTITLTGDVTGTGTGSFSATIPAGTVTLSQQANLAANSIIGNNTGSAATPLALTGTQATAMLDVFTSGAKGLVPASGGGTTTFLRADGTFVTPSGSSPTTTKGDLIARSSSADSRLPIGTNGQVLTADSAETLGMKWATPSGGGGSPNLAHVEVMDSGWPNFTGGWVAAYNNGDIQKVTFTSEIVDQSNAWNTTNNEYTCPEAGTYIFVATPTMVSDMANSRRGTFFFVKNGTALYDVPINTIQDDNARQRGAAATWLVPCAVNDVISLGYSVYQSNTRLSVRLEIAKI